MNYVYFKAKQGNFGDDLNGWLWPQFFGPDNLEDDYFIGIGSILFKESKLLKSLSNKKKIIFGSGIRPAYKPFIIDDTWDVQFLRGPLSAGALGNKHEYISDSAYALRLTKGFKQLITTEKKYKISVIPYFHSLKYFDWENLCQKLGYHYISPLSEAGVEHTMQEIASSEHIITEAMHGAIVADALRVPWSRFILTTPYTEGQMISEFKWMDWLYSAEVLIDKPVYIQFYRNSFLNRWVKTLSNQIIDAKFFLKRKVEEDILKQLSSVTTYYLSKNAVIEKIDNRIQQKITSLQEQLAEKN